MKSKLYILLLAVIILIDYSCKTASKLYDKGKYDEAVELAAKKLQKDPHDAKLLSTIRGAYDYAVNDHESRIRSNSESNNELRWEWMYNEYASLQRMYDAIYKVPSVFNLVKPVDYSSYLVTYSEKAGDVRYNRGLSFMQHSDKQSFRNAYQEFQAAQRFKPGNIEVLQKMNEAYEYAVTNVVILPMEQQYGFRYSSFDNSYRNFDEQLLRNLQYNTGSEFVKFYSDWDARSRNIRADQVVDMRLTTLNIGRYYDEHSRRQVSKEVVIKEIVYRPDSVVKVYGKVYAEIITTRRNMHSDAMMQVNVRDASGGWLWSDNVNSDYNRTTEFASYTGDERALSESDKQLVNRRQEQPPREEEIIRCLMDEINNNALYRIKNYFNRY
jgi:tetratricopeptide (TPR) repeat protein